MCPEEDAKHTGMLPTASDRQGQVDLKNPLQFPQNIVHTTLRHPDRVDDNQTGNHVRPDNTLGRDN